MTTAPILRVSGVTKSFGGLTAVDDVSLDVAPGEIVGIIGPNGAGKTSLFNLISGFLRPSTGRIQFKGNDVAGLAPHALVQRGLVRSFQSVEVFGGMTVLDALITAGLSKLDLKEAVGQAHDVIDRLGLSGKKESLPPSLSLPDRKLLEIGKCLCVQPDLILLDEVTAGLTLAEAEIPVGLIRGLRESGITFLVVEHVMPVIMGISDRVVVINFGRKIAEGTPEEVVATPEVQRAYFGEAEDIA